MSTQPKENEMVLTVFWADNFDKIVENATGGGPVHTTLLVVFQEQTEKTSLEYINVSVWKTKSRKINFNKVTVVIRLADAKKSLHNLTINTSHYLRTIQKVILQSTSSG